MDSFIKIIRQKKEEPVTTLHTNQIELLKKYISERKNVFICGSSGVGKSYLLKSALDEINSIEIEKDHLKSKSPFLSFIQNAPKHAFIEDYDSDFKSIIEKVSDGGRMTRGSLVVTSVNMCIFPNFEIIFIPRHKPGRLLTLIEDRSSLAENAAIRCNGNIRDFFTYLDGFDDKDVFKTPKEYIKDILSDPDPIGIPDSIHEHGHIWDIFQENYLDSKGVDVTGVTDAFCEADMYDTQMYTMGNWHLMPYFILNALVIPKSALGKPLDKDTIRPGSCWTKYGNYRMRNQKYKEIQKRGGNNLCIDDLCLIKKYAENGDLQPMLDYGLTPQDFDVMNHLAVGNRLKQRDVTRVKKALKYAYEQGKA
jgi:hypothetical protein|tara:strand:- start:37 stop:1131 length:1095 start_codon:yes stop_codon:yes gene_type:complete